MEPLVRIDGLREALTSVTVLPVSKSPNVRTPLRETTALGRELRFCGVEKQHDRTVQKLMMADGRREEPDLIFLNSFPDEGNLSLVMGVVF